ncbi:hypothetical protein KS4_12560 [Poriferisphaera corsica]|uniref:Uncharacterized protein n=1 Tax=Poriferisphaera corsica TaxID=2528020 RepID=A0A517YSM2_9BACT|nr:hypothetical protein KS4_12560 [Poriferisphaera corsica]
MDSENGIYTVLLAVASLSLLVAVGFVAMCGMDLYGGLFIS